MKPKTIVMSSDARGLEPNATVIASLLAHTDGPLWVRMFTRDIEPVVVESGRLRLEVIRTPEELRLEGRVPAHVNAGGTFDRIAAIPYCGDWEQAAVLDYDQVVVGDLNPLFELDFRGALLAGRLWGEDRTRLACPPPLVAGASRARPFARRPASRLLPHTLSTSSRAGTGNRRASSPACSSRHSISWRRPASVREFR